MCSVTLRPAAPAPPPRLWAVGGRSLAPMGTDERGLVLPFLTP